MLSCCWLHLFNPNPVIRATGLFVACTRGKQYSDKQGAERGDNHALGTLMKADAKSAIKAFFNRVKLFLHV
jgi:hypothetical protein